MDYNVLIIKDAEDDLLDIYWHVAVNDSIEKAEELLNKLEDTCSGLSKLAKRGHCPPELEHIGVLNYREIHYKPYRIIYQVIGPDVFIHCILDGRRDLQQLLFKRLTRE